MPAVKRIGILTSGGDCAGLNAVIRAVVHRAADAYGWQVIGIRNGTAGLLALLRLKHGFLFQGAGELSMPRDQTTLEKFA